MEPRSFRRLSGAEASNGPRPPEAVEQLVASTEGLPLAIELAAARCQVLSIEEVTKRIQAGTAKLRDRTRAGRHGCLLACVQESLGALQPATQQALARLCALPTDLDYGLAVEFTGDEAHIEALLDAALLYKQDYRWTACVSGVSPGKERGYGQPSDPG